MHAALPMTFFLPHSFAAWNTDAFDTTFKREVEALDTTLLPLQQALAHSSAVADEPFHVVPMAARETPGGLAVKAGVFYAGITGGCSCADDPTPLESQTEHCVLAFEIDAPHGATRVTLVQESAE